MLDAIGRSWASPRWAVIKDARSRQRQRQRRMFAAVAALLLAAAVGWLVDSNPQSRPAAASPSVAVATGDQLQFGGFLMDTTTLRGHVWVLTCQRQCSRPSGSPWNATWSTAGVGELIKLAANGRPIKRISVTDPTVLTGGDGAIWIAHFDTDEVTRIDPQTGQITATIHLETPKPYTTSGDRRFRPSGISFGAGQVWVSMALGWIAGINAHTSRLERMIFSSSEATSATTAAGLTWVADELAGVGIFSASSHHVKVQQIDWARQPVDIATVAHGAGRIWALGDVFVPTPKNLNRYLDIVTAIDPRTRRVLQQWNIPGADSIVFANGTPYIGELGRARVIRLTGPRTPQILHLPGRVAALTAATPRALWATTQNGQLLRIGLPMLKGDSYRLRGKDLDARPTRAGGLS
jgi:hypothetical protein